ncbi:MAG: GNAT family N-acetyltransferase, partial [Anaerolineae bacterium]|nr:GNAT family N-acetyltransferase [Anaerolineae bacterium]
LRQRADQRGRDAESSVTQLRVALEKGRIRGACMYDGGVARGFAAWRWRDKMQTHAQVLVLYVEPEAAPSWGQALVEYVFSALHQSPALDIIEVRFRDEAPGAREAWMRRDLVLFERCRMVRPLRTTPIPVLPLPKQVQIVPWQDDFQAGVERVAVQAHQGGIEAVADPHIADEARQVERLRRLWAGQLSGVDAWNPTASLVALNKKRVVVGYIVLAQVDQDAHIIDLALDPAYQRRGIARALLVRSMTLCLKQGVRTVVLPLTTGNSARNTCIKLGFQAADCGEVAVWWRDGRQLVWRT